MRATRSRTSAATVSAVVVTSRARVSVVAASARTSSATMVNPRPLPPARDASMAALSASRLVCSAISATEAVIWPTLIALVSSAATTRTDAICRSALA